MDGGDHERRGAVDGWRVCVCMAERCTSPLWIKPPHPPGEDWQQEKVGVSAFGVHQRHSEGLVVWCQRISSEWQGGRGNLKLI